MLCAVVHAQDSYYVSTEVSNNAPAVNEQVRITYNLKFKGSSGSFDLSGIRVNRQVPDGFDLADERAGMNMSLGFGFGSDMTLYNYTQVLRPTKQGTFTLPPVEFVWTNKSYKSDLVKIYVGAAPPQSQREETRQYFIEISLNRKSAYVGEQVIMTLRLYTQLDVRGIRINSQPNFRNFYKQELNPNNRPKVARVGNRQYHTSELAKYVLTPIVGGEVKIGPYDVSAQIVVGRGFFADLRDVTLRSNTATINVKELPASGKPASFTGAVGNFTMKPQMSSEETVTDEPITYRITISGSGDFNFVKEPRIELPPDFEVYDPKVTSTMSADKTSGSKTFEYLIIPRRQGEFVLKPYEFAWFDPSKQRYFSAKTPSYNIKVGKGNGIAGTSRFSGIAKEDVELLDEDIRYIKTAPLTTPSPVVFGKPAFVALMIAPLLLFIPLLLLRRYRDQRLSDEVIRQNRIAGKRTRRSLNSAKRFLSAGDARGFHAAMRNTLETWLSNKLRIAQSELSRDRILNELQQRNVNAHYSEELLVLLNTYDQALYAPASSELVMQESFAKATQLLTRLQSELK